MGAGTRLVLLACTAAVLAGCSSPSDTIVIAVDDRPTPTLELECASLIPQPVIDAAFNPSTLAVELASDGAGGHYSLAQRGLEQAGALRCEWSDRGAVGDNESYLQVSVLADAEQLWAKYSGEVAVFQPSADSYGDASFHSCQSSSGYSYCRIDVLVADRWMNAVLGGLASVDAAAPVIEAAVSALADATAAESGWTTEATSPGCEQLAPAAELNAALGTDVEPWERLAPTQPVLLHAGFDAAGGVFCSWRNSFSSASAMTVEISVLPGGAWAWENYWQGEPSDRVTRQPAAGLGDEVYSGCTTDAPCFVSVLSGDTWFDVTVNDESSPDETAVALEIARLVLESLG